MNTAHLIGATKNSPRKTRRARRNARAIEALALSLLVLLTLAPACRALSSAPQAATDSEDASLAPYFFLPGGDSGIDLLPLESTKAQVTIVGVIADVRVTQVYQNRGLKPIEAIYVFPASTRAAVYAMQMTIGERVIKAEIQKREEARAHYEEARKQGRTASLLEQQRPNVFMMNVANILPGDVIKVELKYTELLVPNGAIYRFVYPTVVGPRYAGNGVDASNGPSSWIENPYLHQGETPSYRFEMDLRLVAAVPIQDIRCPSHRVKIAYETDNQASIRLDPGEAGGGDRDFILEYRLAGNRIQSGILLERGPNENFFLLQMEPPARVTPTEITPREYVFVVDVSGSMHGFPLDTAKQLMQDLLEGLQPNDRFNIELFSGGSSLLAEKSLPATPVNIRKGLEFLSRQQGGGGTELLPALKRALTLPVHPRMSRSLVVVTDGYIGVEREVLRLIRDNLDRANIFTFGIGSSVNRYLIEGMARAGRGQPAIVTRPAEARERAEAFRTQIAAPVATHLQVHFQSFDAYDVEPVTVPDLFAERPIIVFGKWRGTPTGAVTVQGETAEGSFTKQVTLDRAETLEGNHALSALWARSRISELADYNRLGSDPDLAATITQLGLKYSLLTDYTSFVAIDQQIRRQDGEITTVKQPLPLPAGVSNYAVGNAAPAGMLGMALTRAAPSAPKAALPSFYSQSTSSVKEMDAESDSGPRHRQEAKGAPKITIEGIKTEGALDAALIRKKLEPGLEQLAACLDASHIQLRKLKVRIMIGADGLVEKIELLDGGTGSAAIEKCLKAFSGLLKFPTAADGKSTLVEICLS